jgi:hypothetical protein
MSFVNCRRMCIHVILPLVAGILIYVLWRSPSLLVFDWLEMIGLQPAAVLVRELAAPFEPSIPPWVLFNLPDGLWTYSMASAVLLTWQNRSGRGWIGWYAAAATLPIAGEIAQMFGLLPGTYEAMDLLFDGLGSVLALTFLGKR